MTLPSRLVHFGVALLASRLQVLGNEVVGGSEVVFWEDAAILRGVGIPVRAYGANAVRAKDIHRLPLRTHAPLLSSLEYCGQLLRQEREAFLIAYNEPTVAGLAPSRSVVRFDWSTPLPRYWRVWGWRSRFERALYLFPSDSERELFLDQHSRIPREATFVLPNAVDLTLFRPVEPRPDGSLRVGFAGQWEPRKGVSVLLDAWNQVRSKLPGAELWMAGGPHLWKNRMDSPDAEALAARISQAEQQKLLGVVGELPRRQMPEFWSSVSVAVVPSLYEPFGLVALEALACGVPVVATRVGGLQEIVEHERSGLLVSAGEPGPLAEALVALLTQESLRRRLAEGARRRAEAFSLERRSRDLLALLSARAQRLAAV
jgi:glycosyltransferase involved in cell wall biosynthesis